MWKRNLTSRITRFRPKWVFQYKSHTRRTVHRRRRVRKRSWFSGAQPQLDNELNATGFLVQHASPGNRGPREPLPYRPLLEESFQRASQTGGIPFLDDRQRLAPMSD